MMTRLVPWHLPGFLAALWLGIPAVPVDAVDFNRDVRPVLSEHCFPCHGQDASQRKAKLRLDTAEGGRGEKGGPKVIEPGRPDASELVRRVYASDPNEQMPPPDAHRALTAAQRQVLREWVVAGAPYAEHWAFAPIHRPSPPAVGQSSWLRQPMDAFVLAPLEAAGLGPAPEAPPAAWLRRVSFDLTGLPPSTGELVDFEAEVADVREAAYANAAERLLGSPRYGERQAQEWLDVARFADTHGFNNDTTRTVWRWRDWVIDAFNRNLPYDRFLTEQLAGDLLPGATLDQRIATGFGRNHVVNSEGGIIDEEYRVEYVADRVRTLGLAWLGLTLECCRCHDHKFDPLSQRDYYRLFAFFNNVPEFGEDGRIGNAAPLLAAPTSAQQGELARVEDSLTRELAALAAHPTPAPALLLTALRERSAAVSIAAPGPALFTLSVTGRPPAQPHPQFEAAIELPQAGETVLDLPATSFSPGQPWTLATWLRWEGGEGPILSTMDHLLDPTAGGSGRGAEVRVNAAGRLEVRLAEFWPAYAVSVSSEEALSVGDWRHITATYDGSTKAAGVRLFLEGRPADLILQRDGLSGRSASSHAPRLGRTIAKVPEVFRGAVAGLRLYTNVVAEADLAQWVQNHECRWLVADEAARTGAPDRMRDLGLAWLSPAYAEHRRQAEALQRERQEILRLAPQTMVMEELSPPRPSFVLQRGRYDARGERVEPGVPESLLGPWPDGAPRNRLGLARWLTQPANPLTARVVVNRIWAQLFGLGIVRTVEDFGVQGEPPSHLALLDALAGDFIEQGWDVKRLLRTAVLSATYRQDSTLGPAARERDPANRQLARGPRVRLPAESLRDHALALAGLLRHRVGGPSVFPLQPESLYTGVVVAADYPGTRWVPSEGDDLQRRSLYTFWKRTVPHPVMTTFDAPDREVCTARRLPTNTPQQALALMNEPSFVQAGQALGSRALQEGGKADTERLRWLFRSATSRVPEDTELAALRRTLDRLRDDFAHDPAGARDLLRGPGTSTSDPANSRLPGPSTTEAEAAAWATLGGLVLNLDETITKY